jgi:hypothetical protein
MPQRKFSADTRWYGQITMGFYHVLGRDTVEFQDQFFLYVGGGGLGNKQDSEIGYDALATTE